MAGDEVLGIYATISTPAVLTQAMVGMLYTPLVGTMAEEWTSGDSGRIIRYLGRAMGFMAVALLACSTFLILVGPPLLLLVFGDSLAADLWIFPWSILVTALIAVVGFGLQVLIVFRHAKAALLACGVALVLAVALAAPAIQTFAINGINLSIAVAYIVGIVIETTAIVRAIRRHRIDETEGMVTITVDAQFVHDFRTADDQPRVNIAIRPFCEMNESGFIDFCLASFQQNCRHFSGLDASVIPPVVQGSSVDDCTSVAKCFVGHLMMWLFLWEYVCKQNGVKPYPLTSFFDLKDPYGFESCLDALHDGVPIDDIVA